MILITDAHVSTANENVEPFFQMLQKIEDYDDIIVFLGDIFDLWISLPGYEEDIQRRFVSWCKNRLDRAGVGFVEGNHEFFVVRRHHEAFRWSTGESHRENHLLFVHGDLINPDDRNYILFRKVTKNGFVRNLVRFLPFGRSLVHRLKQKLKHTGKDFKMGLPYTHLAQYAEQQFKQGIDHVLIGHFHQEYRVDGEGGRFLQVLPDWFATGKISIYDGREILFKHWQDY